MGWYVSKMIVIMAFTLLYWIILLPVSLPKPLGEIILNLRLLVSYVSFFSYKVLNFDASIECVGIALAIPEKNVSIWGV